MILSDIDIRKELAAGRIEIDPFDETCVQPSSVDLHVDRQFRVFANSRYPYIDVRREMPDLTEMVEVADDEAFILHPASSCWGRRSSGWLCPTTWSPVSRASRASGASGC